MEGTWEVNSLRAADTGTGNGSPSAALIWQAETGLNGGESVILPKFREK